MEAYALERAREDHCNSNAHHLIARRAEKLGVDPSAPGAAKQILDDIEDLRLGTSQDLYPFGPEIERDGVVATARRRLRPLAYPIIRPDRSEDQHNKDSNADSGPSDLLYDSPKRQDANNGQ